MAVEPLPAVCFYGAMQGTAPQTEGQRRLAICVNGPRGSKRKLAAVAGISDVTLSHLLSGRRRPSLDVALALEKATRGRVKVQSWARQPPRTRGGK
jgi:transcriptional regulator with XRE-family HTH domain